LGAEFGSERITNAVDDERGDDANNDDGPTAKPNKHARTKKKDWTMHVGGGGQHTNPVPYTGEAEHFGVKLEEGNWEKMRDNHGTICLHLVLFVPHH
jgi:hypothetical protein